MPEATFSQFWRIRTESAFDAANPESGGEWNDGLTGGANGWLDLPVVREADGLQPKTPLIYPSTASGSRAMNAALPIAGADVPELGNLEFAVYPELIDRVLRMVFGSVSRTPTAGAMDSGGAQLIDADPKEITPGTQSDGTEQVKIVITGTNANSSAKIEIIQSSTVQETINIGSGSDCNGTYYSKGGYDGSSNAVSVKFYGMGTAGSATITGVDFSTNVFTAGATNPTGVIEQGGRPEAGSGNSEYFPGIVIPTLVLNYDRSAAEGLLMANATIHGVRPDTATAGTYADDAATYYKPIAAWTGAITVDASSYLEVVSMSMTLQPNNALYAVSSGNQQASGAQEGEIEAFGTMTVLPADNTRWNDYRNATVRDVELTFTTPHYVVDTTGYQVKLEFTQMTFADYTRNRQPPNLGAELAFRAIYNSTDSGPSKLTTICRMPV